MTDIFTKEKRSEVMSLIRGKDTKPEVTLRRLLFREGFRYSLHNRKLPGRPDIVLAKYKAVIFIHGCYWHGHENCRLYRLPKSNQEFWREKIEQNRKRDKASESILLEKGWRILVIWECALRGKANISETLELVRDWLTLNEGLVGLSEIQAPLLNELPTLSGDLLAD